MNVSSVNISNPDTHSVTITAINGCSNTNNFVIEADTTRLNVTSLTADLLSCTELSYLYIEADDDINDYLWTYPGDYTSIESTPVLTTGGVHYVSIYGSNGCETIDSIDIPDDRLFPILEVSDIYIRCDGLPTTFIIDTITENSSIVWEGLSLDYYEKGFDAAATEEGTYEAIAINEAGCQARDTFRVINEVYLPEFDLTAGLLYCDGAEIGSP